MESPIRCLLPHITGKFENTYKDFSQYAKTLIEQQKVDPIISLDDTGKFASPVAMASFGKIIINEPFMCALWSFCYYYFVMHEEYVVPYYNEGKSVKNQILDEAEKLFQWGKSLKNGYSCWPQDLPMPIQYAGNSYVHIVNQIFLYAMNFIMCHEFAHIVKAPQKGTLIEQEREADDVAFELMLKGRDGNNDFTIYLGVIMGLATLIVLNSNIKDSPTHPSSISRLDTFMKRINLEETHTLWCITTIILHDWNMRNDFEFVFPMESDTFKSRYEEMMGIIKKQNHYV